MPGAALSLLQILCMEHTTMLKVWRGISIYQTRCCRDLTCFLSYMILRTLRWYWIWVLRYLNSIRILGWPKYIFACSGSTQSAWRPKGNNNKLSCGKMHLQTLTTWVPIIISRNIAKKSLVVSLPSHKQSHTHKLVFWAKVTCRSICASWKIDPGDRKWFLRLNRA